MFLDQNNVVHAVIEKNAFDIPTRSDFKTASNTYYLIMLLLAIIVTSKLSNVIVHVMSVLIFCFIFLFFSIFILQLKSEETHCRMVTKYNC